MKKKTSRILFLLAALLPVFTACDSLLGPAESPSYSGFSEISVETVYANTPRSYVSFVAFGDWEMSKVSDTGGGDWVKVDTMAGRGGYYYYIRTYCNQNTTGKWRGTQYRIQDKGDGDVYATFWLYQYATRGDGSYGGSPLVKSITGDDGSLIELAYDSNDCVTQLKMKKGETVLRDWNISYTSDSVMHVNTGYTTLSCKHDMGFQMAEDKLVSASDTFAVNLQYDTYTYSAFSVIESQRGLLNGLSMMFQNQKFTGDNDHVADSIRYYRDLGDGSRLFVGMKMEYSEDDNRNQSVDANQLLLGIENCNPYCLISVFRFTRNSKLVKTASTAAGDYKVATELNGDKSVKTMTVTDPQGKTITYNFDYYAD